MPATPRAVRQCPPTLSGCHEEINVGLAALSWAAVGAPADMELSVSDDRDGLVVLECLVDQLREQCLPILLDMLSKAGTDRPARRPASRWNWTTSGR